MTTYDATEPRTTEAPVQEPTADDDGGRSTARRLAKVVEYLSFESQLQTRERILKLRPEVRAGLAKAVRLLEIAVIPSAMRPGTIQISEPQDDDDVAIATTDQADMELKIVPEVSQTEGEALTGTVFLRNIIGDISDLRLTTSDAPAIVKFLITLHGPFGSRVKLPWDKVLEDRFQNVSIEDIAVKYGLSSAQRLREYFSAFGAEIKNKYTANEAGRLFRIAVGAPITASVAIDDSALIRRQPGRPRKPSQEEGDVSTDVVSSPENGEKFDTIGTFTQLLKLDEHEQQALEQFLAIEAKPDASSRPNNEVQDVVGKLRTFILSKTTGPQDPRLKLDIDQRAALTRTLGWYQRGGTLHFQGAMYAKNYVIVNRITDKSRVKAIESAYERIARVGLLLQDHDA